MKPDSSASTITLLRRFLTKAGCRIDIVTIRNIYDKHPLPHSIRSLSDTLDALSIPNMVCNISVAQLFEAPAPSIVFLKKSNELFYIFNGINKDNTVELHSATDTLKISIAEFCKNWDGDILFAEKGENSKNVPILNYAFRQVFWFVSQSALCWIAGLFIAIILWNIFFNGSVSANNYEKAAYILNLLGLAVSTIIIIKTYWNGSLLQSLCLVKNHDRCKDTFNSKGAFLFGLLPLGIMAWTYFFTTIIWGIFISDAPISVLLFCSFLSLGFVIYSVIWQWIKREICIWCTILDVLLVLAFLLLVTGGHQLLQNLKIYPDLLMWGVLYILVFLSVYKICALLPAAIQNKRLRGKHEILLSANELLPYMLSFLPVVLTPEFNTIHPISNGLKDFEYRITVVMNPLCSHCGKLQRSFQSSKIVA